MAVQKLVLQRVWCLCTWLLKRQNVLRWLTFTHLELVFFYNEKSSLFVPEEMPCEIFIVIP